MGKKFDKETEFHSDSDNNASKWSLMKMRTIKETFVIGQRAGVQRNCLT